MLLSPTQPTPTSDKRHDNIQGQIEIHGKHDVGVVHLAYWIPKYGNEKGPVVSAPQVMGSYRYRHVAIYQAKMQGYYRRLAPMKMMILAPETYERYKESQDELSKRRPDYKLHYGQSASPFLGLAIVRNLRVLPHRDEHDVKGGLVGMTQLSSDNVGQGGGDLIVGTARRQYRLRYPPKSIVLFASQLLIHGVTPFGQAKRTALVSFAHHQVLRSSQ